MNAIFLYAALACGAVACFAPIRYAGWAWIACFGLFVLHLFIKAIFF